MAEALDAIEAPGAFTDRKVEELQEQLISAMPPRGSIGNGALRIKLGWNEDPYWYIRNKLLQSGHIEERRGRGGNVRLVLPMTSPVRVNEASFASQESRITESALYDPIIATIRSHWVPDHNIQDFVIDRTAHQGRRDTGGKWTRPDITLASYNIYRYVPGKQVELNTFEVKTYDGLDVTAVYEALAHRRAAHYSYVLAYVPDSERVALGPLLERLCADADDHGIGFVLMKGPKEYGTWNFEVQPTRHEPDPANVDNFIRTQTSDEFKDKILGWCRTL